MIEIILIILVARAFGRQAEARNLSKPLWQIIGAASYYLPILLMSLLVLPALARSGFFGYGDPDAMRMKFVGINLLTGVGCCMIAWIFLRNQGKHQPHDPTILDDGSLED